MPLNYFVTGMPRSGKTTLLRRISKKLRELGLKVGGFTSPEEKEHGTRTGFYVQDIQSGKIARLADMDADGPKVSKYHVDVKSFEGIALPILSRYKDFDVVVIDEIGMMELKSQQFSDMLDELLESETPLIASLHNDLIDKYGYYGEVLYLSEDTREFLFTDLVRKVSSMKGGRNKQQAKAQPQKAAPELKKIAPERPPLRQKEERPAEKQKEAKRPKREEKRDEKGEVEKAFEEEKEDEGRGKKRSFMDKIVDLLGL